MLPGASGFSSWLAPLVCALALLRVQEHGARGAAAPLLAAGPFAVGFRSTWAFDEGRTYRTAWDDGRTYGAEKAPRPVLVQLWFPARATPVDSARMPHGGYFAITDADVGGKSLVPGGCSGRDERVKALAAALRVHAFGVFVQEVFGEPESGLDGEERAELEGLLATSTLCRLAAEPAAGPFPLVVYHSGAGSSFEDNAALCEFLASHGYVVLGSAYPKADGSALGIDAGRGSAEDAQFLVRWARALPFADWRRVALIGHSAGAQAFLRYAAQPGCVADALVLLDTTQDYYGLAMPLHESVVREATEGVAHLTRAINSADKIVWGLAVSALAFAGLGLEANAHGPEKSEAYALLALQGPDAEAGQLVAHGRDHHGIVHGARCSCCGPFGGPAV